MRRLSASVRAWMHRIVESRTMSTFRRTQTNLDGVMRVRKRRDGDAPRTRIRQASFTRAPGRRVDWPGAVPSEWRRRHYEEYLD